MHVERVDRKDPNFRNLKENPLTQDDLDAIQIEEDITRRASKLTESGIKDLRDQIGDQVKRLNLQFEKLGKILDTFKGDK